MTIPPGTQVGHFVIKAPLGAGGLGTVYLAEDQTLRRNVALKFLTAATVGDPMSARRLLREAQVTGALDHPNIAAVYEIGEWSSLPFIALAYCPGETISQRLATGPLPVSEAIAILGQIARGLSHAHSAGVVHRDLKPANLMIGPDGHVRILDFGIARLTTGETSTATRLTVDGETLGTIAYMAPEQVRGEPVDERADVWALGVTLYEMLSGVLPFRGDSVFSMMHAILHEAPAPLGQFRPDVPPWLESIVDAALQKSRSTRNMSATDILRLLETQNVAARPRSSMTRARRFGLIAATAVAATAVAVGGWVFSRHSAAVRAARERDLPALARLVEQEQFYAAFDLARGIEKYVATDPEWRRLFQATSRQIDIDSVPDRATVYYRPYGHQQEPWRRLGQTPLRQLSIPRGLQAWKVEKDGFVPAEDVGLLPQYIALRRFGPDVPHMFVLDRPDHRPAGMVRASPRGFQLLAIAGLEHVTAFELQDFWIDRTEVTNRDFKRFVDAGGYRDPRYWKQPFVRGGVAVSWKDALAGFHDRSGRAGPALWEFGTYPEGKDDLPVGGVSWFEAAAYAEFAGKQLPTIFHWSVVADRRATSHVLLPRGRYFSDGPLPVGQAGAVSRYGTEDMAGNVKEWCWNEAADDQRYTLGGGWSDPAYFFNDADARSPWDRAPALGFRCMKLTDDRPLPAALTARVPFEFRDFSRERPVSNEVFAAFKAQYAYDRTDLAPRVRASDDTARDWRHETVEINAAYGGERFTVHVLLPKHAKPPFQTVVFFPGINALHERSFDANVIVARDLDYLLLSGRAVVYPIYKSTYERSDDLISDFPAMTTLFRDHVIMWSKDVQRTVDYLQSRPDIAPDKIAYLGVSWGAAMGTIMVAAEPRFALAVFHVGGFYSQHARPEVEAINFAPRVKVPSLMLNGQYDLFYPVDVSQRFMFNLLGPREPEKRKVVYPTGHGLPRHEMITETLGWMDRHFGPVDIR